MSSNQFSAGSEKRQFWQMVMETWQDSGLSVRQFCKNEGLSEPSFYFWRRKLNQTKSTPGSQQATVSGAFIEVSIPSNAPAALELVLSSGNILRIGTAADSSALSRVISVLREAGLC